MVLAFKVHITYKNEEREPVSERDYSIEEYSDLMKNDLFRVITDIEDIVYLSQEGKSKEAWPPSVLNNFNKIKHKLLDKAGEISRLPCTLQYVESKEEDVSEWIAKLFR